MIDHDRRLVARQYSSLKLEVGPDPIFSCVEIVGDSCGRGHEGVSTNIRSEKLGYFIRWFELTVLCRGVVKCLGNADVVKTFIAVGDCLHFDLRLVVPLLEQTLIRQGLMMLNRLLEINKVANFHHPDGIQDIDSR